MIDSVLKGTGNSRFLKSAVPAGTSWADALAMLQAGTFPIDFNGINTEGFQQVGTPLNKANLLKDATAAQIGLPPSTTPDGMFQALGNTGELHVWRKTVVYNQPVPEVPGSYTLGTTQQLIVATRNTSNASRGSGIKGALASNSLSVDLAGNVSLENPGTIDILVTGRGNPTETASAVLSGYTYFMIPDSATGNYCDITMPRNTVYFVPSYATYDPASMAYGEQSNFDAAQLVTGVPGTPAIPAGTTTTYPVSTNPNAYQEGDDAKPAGYTLGEVVSGSFRMSDTAPRNAYLYKYANSVAVKENGEVVLQNPEAVNFNSDSHIGYESTVLSLVAGKFLYYYGRDSMADDSSAPDTKPPFNATPSEIVYVPADAAITATNTYPAGFYLDKYQPVTGYAAIPAGTTIEYLGKLGDKARVQVVSYVGTGTYGSSNPNSLTFDFVPKMVFIFSQLYSNAHVYNASIVPDAGVFSTYITSDGDNTRSGFCNITRKNKTITWYRNDVGVQLNISGVKYFAVAIG